MDVVRMLIDRGADVLAESNEGDTPLHLASQEGHVEVVHMLVERAADVSGPRQEQEDPITSGIDSD